jgi:hypothetical protein
VATDGGELTGGIVGINEFVQIFTSEQYIAVVL